MISHFNKMASMIGFISMIWIITCCLDENLRTEFTFNNKKYNDYNALKWLAQRGILDKCERLH